MSTSPPSTIAPAPLERPIYRRIVVRLVAFVTLMYLLNQFDRGNLAFARETLSADIGLSNAAFGLGAGIFFIGYFLFEVPSNLLLHRFGARRWLARIMITWGLVTFAMMFTQDTTSFYILRFALGAAEAGFFPGAVYFISQWLPSRERGKVMALLSAAGPAAYLLAGPLSGVLLGLDGRASLHGWQWLFLIEGLMTVTIGILCLFVLVDSPRDARWLDEREKAALQRSLREDIGDSSSHETRIWHIVRQPRVLLLAGVYTCMQITNAGLIFWLPAITSRIGGLSTLEVTSLSVAPYAFQIIGLFVLGQQSDKHGRRHLYVLLGCLCIAAGLAASALVGPAAGLIALCLSFFGYGTMSAFWSLASSYLDTTSGGAAGLAFVNSIAALGGFVGPTIFGFLKDLTGSDRASLLVLTLFGVLASALVLFVRDPRDRGTTTHGTPTKEATS
ncbi:MFS transporter [Brachybacterium sacelli]|uniref:MFS family permease n=1 Tax=Brachybacterium sacelli TaxID=173364 RepID=A0ABS4WVE4_9MICO|nr:MFS transporter [Brachybacterium sacelli]MBP2380172.1 MFS family permease [Brachybacterium sacelli]